MFSKVFLRYKGSSYRTGMLLDTGSSMTILKNSDATTLGIKCSTPTDHIEIGGERLGVCKAVVAMHVEGSDCLVQKMPVMASVERNRDVPISIAGSDFLQRTGAILDQRKGKHAIFCDVNGRNEKARATDPPVLARSRKAR